LPDNESRELALSPQLIHLTNEVVDHKKLKQKKQKVRFEKLAGDQSPNFRQGAIKNRIWA
jgi:hypothetical protein